MINLPSRFADGAQPPLATQLSQFGRELIDLLKTFPKCTLPFSRLIPSYHAHFGRLLRVAIQLRFFKVMCSVIYKLLNCYFANYLGNVVLQTMAILA